MNSNAKYLTNGFVCDLGRCKLSSPGISFDKGDGSLGVFLKTVNLQLILLHKATCDEQLANILALIALRFSPFTDLQNSFDRTIIITHTCLSLIS